MTLGEKIKLHRQNLGLSQEALAEKLNVSRQAVTKWESDAGVPDIDNLIALSKMMDITLDELVLGEGARDVQDTKKGAENQRAIYRKLYLIAVVCFVIAGACWLISLVLNIVNGNELAAVLSAVNIMLLGFPIGIFLRKYFELV